MTEAVEGSPNRTPGSEPPLPRVSVVGSGTAEHRDRALQLGQALAVRKVHLITGGGEGVMAQVARGFAGVSPRAGLSIGILPAGNEGGREPRGYPNPWVELPIRTHLPSRGAEGQSPGSRNHIVVLTGELVIALPGAAGTLSEVELALEYGRPVVAHLTDRSDLPGLPGEVPLAPSLAEVLGFLEEVLASRESPPGF